jgi:hypothetical protein
MAKAIIQRDITEVLADLPKMCAAYLPSDNSPIWIARGATGYWPAPADLDVNAFNTKHAISKAQVEAMFAGSMFGWHVPGADPLNY